MRYENTPQLTKWLAKDFPLLSAMPGFTLDNTDFEKHLIGVSGRPANERRDAAAFRCLTHGFKPTVPVNPSASAIPLDVNLLPVLDEIKTTRKLVKNGIIAVLILLFLLLYATAAHAQNSNVAVVVAACGTPPTNIPAASAGSPARVYLTVDTNGQICINGTITGGNSAASATGAAVPANAGYTGLNVSGTLRGATGTNTSGAVYAIDTNCVAGCAGGTNDVDDDSIVTGQTTGIQIPLNYVFDGTDWKRFTVSQAGTGLATGLITVQGHASGTPIPISGTVTVSGVAATEYIQDAALTVATTQGGMAMCRASATVPTDVSANNDASMNWCLRSGALAVQLTNAGVLTLSGSGTATGALRVELPTNGTGVIAGVTTVSTVSSVTAIANALPAGNNNIGDIDVATIAAGNNNIGDVDVASIVPGTGATNLGKAEDAVAGSGDTGVPPLCVIQASLTAPAADLDYTVPKCNANGALYTASILTDAAAGAAVTTNPVQVGGVYTDSPLTLDAGDAGYILLDVNGRVQVHCDNCGAGTQYTQDAALTIATTVGTMAMCRASAAAPTNVSAGDDAVLPWCLLSGAQVIQLSNAGVLTLSGSGTATGALRVKLPTNGTGVIATVGAVTAITNALPAGNNNIGDIDIASGTVTTVSTVTTLSQLGGVALPIEDAAETPGGVGIYAMTVRRNVAAASTATTAENATLNTDALGLLWSRHLDPCSGVTKVYKPISITTATTTELVVADASNKVYICSINIGPIEVADNIALVEDDTDDCASPSAGMIGGTTAATGWQVAANGGLVLGNGDSSIAATSATNRYVCIITSSAAEVPGVMTYVLAP